MRVADLLPVLFAFDDAVLAMAADQVTNHGANISCRAGCGACCRQPVPVSEAMYVANKRSRTRACGSSGNRATTPGLTTNEQCRELGMRYVALGVPCPFLEDESCTIRPHRPMRCREYLVTSPAPNCAKPTAETIQSVHVPVKLSEILYRFEDGVGAATHAGSRWRSRWNGWSSGRTSPKSISPARRLSEISSRAKVQKPVE
jgi:Fe-S-cluster containining protein